ncbi:hypothetical protein GCM10011380_16700 [Sphingomonas metalli]|uniref:Uncharacterized protein n=1 Tax=Sphingomonas metalli TaxID=1779358 RepID=A0A916WRI5_9SPHN|nr:hypothetical protein [Sphingomonas metalli]GGB27735.1 hypothetical protein GCM10011380_16700 [Sphingomonas metalli]
MTDLTMTESRTRGGGLRRIAGDLVDIYRRGGRSLRAAPLLAAIAILPEAAQHVAEIKLGMFVSIDAFRALSNDPTRWAFGYAKVAGFVVAFLAFARFQATGSVRSALLVPPRTLARIVLLIALTFALAWPFGELQKQTGSMPLTIALGTASVVIQGAMLLLIIGALVGDRTLSWHAAFTSHLPSALLLTLYLAAAFAPCQLLHMANHKLAMARPEPAVWALMAFDALWVGLFASLVGAALFVGSGVRLTWRGWRD